MYKVHFSPCGAGNYLGEYYDDKPDFDSADSVDVTVGQATPNINAQLAAGGSISGHVIGPANEDAEDICVDAYDNNFDGMGDAVTDADGDYVVEGLPSGSYRVQFSNCGSGSYLSEWYDDQLDFSSADPVDVTAGQDTPSINAQLAAPGTISGKVTGPASQNLSNICVGVFDAHGNLLNFTFTAPNGTYSFGNLRPGSYRVGYSACTGGNYVDQYYNGKPDLASADPVPVTAGQTTPNIDAQLAAGGTISGTVTGPSNQNLSNICVGVLRSNGTQVKGATTGPSGTYTVGGLQTGTYKVQFTPCIGGSGFLGEYYNDKHTLNSADPVDVTVGQDTPNINAQLDAAGLITGKVTGPSNQNLQNVCVTIYTAGGNSVTGTQTDSGGNYSVGGLSSGTYRVGFQACGAGNFLGEYYDDKPTVAAADPVQVTAGQTTPNINAQLAAGGTISGHVSGPSNQNLQGPGPGRVPARGGGALPVLFVWGLHSGGVGKELGVSML